MMYEQPPQNSPQSHSQFWRIYMLAWIFLAAGSLISLSLFFLQSDNRTSLASNATQGDQTGQSELDSKKLRAKVRSLNQTIATLRSDLAQVNGGQVNGGQTNNGQAETTAAGGPPATNVPPLAEPINTANSYDRSFPQGTNNFASGFGQGTSNFTTASIPRTKQAAEPNNAASSQTGAPDGTAQGTQSYNTQVAASPVTILNQPVPSAPTATPAPSSPGLTASGAPLAPAKTRRRGNFATIPLRPGTAPPLPELNDMMRSTIAPASPTYAPRKALATPTTYRPTPAPMSAPTTAPMTKPAYARPTAPKSQTVAHATRGPRAALALSTAGSVTGLRASWLLLTTRHGDAFRDYRPRYVSDPSTGNYRLIAGPISSRAEADRVCTELRSRNVTCGVADYTGTPL